MRFVRIGCHFVPPLGVRPRIAPREVRYTQGIMQDKSAVAPDSTAVRVALWRAMHVQIDPPPHILDDEIGLELAGVDAGWRSRPDMNPEWTRPIRASIVARTRFVEDLLIERTDHGARQ